MKENPFYRKPALVDMQPQEVVGLLLTVLMGISLGLIGAGGSILTVPILVYLFQLPASQATGASLVIVGSVALVGAILAGQRGEVVARAAILFGIPSVMTSFLVRRFLIPALPERLGPVNKDAAILILFAALMLAAAYSMIRSKGDRRQTEGPAIQWIAAGFVAGLVTGVLGAGGGFLIVPALSMVMGLDMRKSVGTSLAIISMNSAVAFFADLLVRGAPDWKLVGMISFIAVGGLLVGARLRERFSQSHLKMLFGWFVVAVAIFVLFKEAGHF